MKQTNSLILNHNIFTSSKTDSLKIMMLYIILLFPISTIILNIKSEKLFY